MSPEIKDLYEAYARGAMDRREFLGKLAALAGGTAAAAILLPALEGAAAGGQIVPKDDPRLETGYVKYPIEGGEMRAYSAKPKGAGKLAGVIVIHENRGLNPHTEDIARRVALEGYHAIAPDALSPFGGTPANPDEARASLPEARPGREHEELRRRRRLSQDRAPSDGQGRLHGFLLGRRRHEPGGRQRPRPHGGHPLLRQPARGRGRPEDQGGHAHPLRRRRRAHQRRHPGVRGGPQEGRRRIHDPHVRRCRVTPS